MKAVGIVVEYNPFHNGHLYHVTEAKKQTGADLVIAVMSGSFLQRGEPALCSKWHRTEMALANGVDLVVELPYLYSTQKAELFAKGAVTILAEMGVDFLNFGSEAGEIERFTSLVETMEQHEEAFNRLVKDRMKEGVSYPRATAEAFTQLQLDPDTLSLQEPNNILGYHYVKAIREGNYSIQASTTPRQQAHYHEQTLPQTAIASATSIRQALRKDKESGLSQTKHVMPEATFRLLINYQQTYTLLHTWEHYFPLLHYKVMASPLESLRACYECEEGLEYRVKEMMMTAVSFEDWMTKMKTKRYTWTRLQRLATHLLTNTTKEEMKAGLATPLPYIRLLGMTAAGQRYLNDTKKQRQLPLVTRFPKGEAIIAKLEERATAIYLSALPNRLKAEQIQQEFKRSPVRPH
ncbi:nucleotidyltransferase [Alkalihalobacillus oceani]|uniref:tRNA(Met) cytidine acetate ligase n=1 Tax=Halalkalibacter oceani TaxID=1653776 RepID=A0A9X2DM84_9BACI|nr:nucleotidyltransferase [Halalkalibacter oceani]MCM3713086.1 nucleotidyltransferase [Halalkalibacter oceani]